jgi:hypothetical protein
VAAELNSMMVKWCRRAIAFGSFALKAGGIIAIWSQDSDTVFEKRLKAAGFCVNRQRSGRAQTCGLYRHKNIRQHFRRQTAIGETSYRSLDKASGELNSLRHSSTSTAI